MNLGSFLRSDRLVIAQTKPFKQRRKEEYMHLGFSDIIAAAVSLAWSGFRYGMRHLQRRTAEHEIGGDVEEVGYTRHITQREI